MTILVAGGAGFIGTNFVINYLQNNDELIVNLDKLTYAGNRNNLLPIAGNKNHIFVHGDISDKELVLNLLNKYQPSAIINFAAESHVDRSISMPQNFIDTNIVGTFHLLESSRKFFDTLTPEQKTQFKFLHISTDEVYGSLEDDDSPFNEMNRYMPNSPYSASKAASDHLVRAYYHTYGLPVLTSHCSNNYGPYQLPEKLIPLVINNALERKQIPIYGDGKQIRDWIYVHDHCRAIESILKRGIIGETYNIGGNNEKTNLEIVQTICDLLDMMIPLKTQASYSEQITFVEDRPGHDRRYAINTSKAHQELGWQPKEIFEIGLKQTISWYLNNKNWMINAIASKHLPMAEQTYENTSSG